jgi:hypothetical protein
MEMKKKDKGKNKIKNKKTILFLRRNNSNLINKGSKTYIIIVHRKQLRKERRQCDRHADRTGQLLRWAA